MKQFKDISLRELHTFGLDHSAHRLYVADSEEDIIDFVETFDDFIILGEGSNSVFTEDITKPILKVDIKGISLLSEDDNTVTIMVNAGENWHDLVTLAVQKGWGGIENLALIPGTVGAAPVQNIGAYGVEISSSLISVRGISKKTNRIHTLLSQECHFSYRNSIFKERLKNDFVITSVTLRLTKRNHHFETSYGPLQEALNAKNQTPTLQNIYDNVVQIRQSKLPDPKKIGNSGSFFKNPIISLEDLNRLKSERSDLVYFKDQNQLFKISAAWLIENSGWKGKNYNGVGVYPKHALVLVNNGNGIGSDLEHLIESIQKSVLENFGLHLIPEVNIY